LVALTKTFKAATKDLGIRGRSDSLRLSPNDLRKMVKGGSREDAGIAATGAPPALIDAISDLLLIPYRETVNIAANFVAGHFSDAIHQFWTQISTETIDRLGVYDSVLGASLIEREIRKLLKDDLPTSHAGRLERLQPFLNGAGITFLATTVNLVTESITTLGADLDCRSYDLMEALLASSAFPAAFAPRRASALYPGTGRRDIFYGDGGMFDNLPAIPAYEALGEVQKDHLQSGLGQGNWRTELRRRHREPDLILVGSLNIRQNIGIRQNVALPDSPKGSGRAFEAERYDSMVKAATRATRLADNEKIHALERVAMKIDRMLSRVEKGGAGDENIAPKTEEFLNSIVNAAVLPVYPSDEQHLNGTFHFCASLGLDRDRARRSIAGGCFQTMRELLERQRDSSTMVGRSLTATNIKSIKLRKDAPPKDQGLCRYFKASGRDIHCPFHTADTIHATCVEDPVHSTQYEDLKKRFGHDASA
jgi:predicted acylesterase/phospholipase RssA